VFEALNQLLRREQYPKDAGKKSKYHLIVTTVKTICRGGIFTFVHVNVSRKLFFISIPYFSHHLTECYLP